MGTRVTPWRRIASGVTIGTSSTDVGVVRNTLGARTLILRIYSPTAGSGVMSASNFNARASWDGVTESVGASIDFDTATSQVIHGKTKLSGVGFSAINPSGAPFPYPHLFLDLQATTAAIDSAVIDAAVVFDSDGNAVDGVDANGNILEWERFMPNMVPQSAMKRLASGNIGDISSAGTTLKVGLLKSTYTPNPDHEFVGDIVAHEISVTGYTGGFGGAGRKTLANKALSEDDTNNFAKMTADPPAWTGLSGVAQTAGYAFVCKEVTNDAASPILSIIRLTPNVLLGDSAQAAYTLVVDDDGFVKLPAVQFL